MSLQEIIDADIDADAIENKHVYKCVTVLKFTQVTEQDGSIDIIPIEINSDCICDEAGTIIKAEPVAVGGSMIYPVSKDIYLIIALSEIVDDLSQYDSVKVFFAERFR